MNSYERYLGVLHGEKVDILPRLPILMAFAAKFIGSNYGAFASDYRVLVEANRRCIEYFDFDQVSAISDPYRETQGFGAEIQYAADGVPRCAAPPFVENPDLALLKKPDPYCSERMLDRIEAVRAFKQYCYECYSILGWIEGPAAEAADLRGVTNFLMDLAVNEDFACVLMDTCVDVGIAFACAQIEAGADTIGIGDAVASQVSPDIYRRLIFPREQRLVHAIRQAGGLVRLHICGNITHLLPYIANLGADIVDLDWAVSVAEARRILGDKIVLTGNLDPVNAVMKSSADKIICDIAEIYQDAGNPYMVGVGCEIPEATPYANLEALCMPAAWKG